MGLASSTLHQSVAPCWVASLPEGDQRWLLLCNSAHWFHECLLSTWSKWCVGGCASVLHEFLLAKQQLKSLSHFWWLINKPKHSDLLHRDKYLTTGMYRGLATTLPWKLMLQSAWKWLRSEPTSKALKFYFGLHSRGVAFGNPSVLVTFSTA